MACWVCRQARDVPGILDGDRARYWRLIYGYSRAIEKIQEAPVGAGALTNMLTANMQLFD